MRDPKKQTAKEYLIYSVAPFIPSSMIISIKQMEKMKSYKQLKKAWNDEGVFGNADWAGQFRTHWNDIFLREISYIVWITRYGEANGDDNKRTSVADKAQKTFLKRVRVQEASLVKGKIVYSEYNV